MEKKCAPERNRENRGIVMELGREVKGEKRRKGRGSHISGEGKPKRQGKWDVRTHRKDMLCLEILQTKAHPSFALKIVRSWRE